MLSAQDTCLELTHWDKRILPLTMVSKIPLKHRIEKRVKSPISNLGFPSISVDMNETPWIR
jgi:hypothetical protein